MTSPSARFRPLRLIALGACTLTLLINPIVTQAQSLTCWFAPEWKAKAEQAKKITDALSSGSGVEIKPRIAESYPQILTAFDGQEQAVLYAGSFVQATLAARGKTVVLAQGINGKELYAGVMIFPKGEDPAKLLTEAPEQIAYAVGASSGESSAKAATGGKAAMGVVSHQAAANAVVAGKARAAFVKNWWWDDNKEKFPTLDVNQAAGVSEQKNPDNVLAASASVPEELRKKITDAAVAAKDAFGMKELTPCDQSRLQFSQDLMRRAQIDPLKYEWK